MEGNDTVSSILFENYYRHILCYAIEMVVLSDQTNERRNGAAVVQRLQVWQLVNAVLLK